MHTVGPQKCYSFLIVCYVCDFQGDSQRQNPVIQSVDTLWATIMPFLMDLVN